MIFIIYTGRVIAGLGVMFACCVTVLAIRELITVHLKYKKNKRIIKSDPVNVYGEIDDITEVNYYKDKPVIYQTINFSYKTNDGSILKNKESITIHVLRVNEFKIGLTIPLCYARGNPEMVIIDLPDIK